MRSYLLALGLTILVIGVFLWFAGSVHIGCTVGGSSMDPTFTDCAGATDLVLGGIALTIVAVVLLVGSLVPDSSSRYK
ncbi:MAG: hypothetical protein L3K10_04485 [Thermoplasmata archaeon]|nr:hypothetical protein [Thermoplasmata archaeon]